MMQGFHGRDGLGVFGITSRAPYSHSIMDKISPRMHFVWKEMPLFLFQVQLQVHVLLTGLLWEEAYPLSLRYYCFISFVEIYDWVLVVIFLFIFLFFCFSFKKYNVPKQHCHFLFFFMYFLYITVYQKGKLYVPFISINKFFSLWSRETLQCTDILVALVLRGGWEGIAMVVADATMAWMAMHMQPVAYQ